LQKEQIQPATANAASNRKHTTDHRLKAQGQLLGGFAMELPKVVFLNYEVLGFVRSFRVMDPTNPKASRF
jgi:hypothetical protein